MANVSVRAIPRISVCGFPKTPEGVPKTPFRAGSEVTENAKGVLQVSDVPESYVFER
jgi:hypothetical protein